MTKDELQVAYDQLQSQYNELQAKNEQMKTIFFTEYGSREASDGLDRSMLSRKDLGFQMIDGNSNSNFKHVAT